MDNQEKESEIELLTHPISDTDTSLRGAAVLMTINAHATC